MSKTFVYDRLDVYGLWDGGSIEEVKDAGGAYVKAEDAINREAVLQAQIRTLETQLKDSHANTARLRRGLIDVQVLKEASC